MLDVAIVGAGVSGVYTGWRLLTDSPPGRAVPTVQVFEQSHRIGGRLLSVEPPGIPGVFCELCGMRYMSSQALVRSLIENKLKLETRPFVVQMPENLNYVRGQRFRNSVGISRATVCRRRQADEAFAVDWHDAELSACHPRAERQRVRGHTGRPVRGTRGP
jgi:flavin-dependent dehydrogenase